MFRMSRWQARIQVPPSPLLLALLGLAFLAPGLTGHDPWRTLDLVSIDIAYRMHTSGDWLVPRLAGEPWFEDAPFYHWLALASGKLFGWALEFHDAARLASGLCMAIALVALYRAGQAWSAPEERAQVSAAAVLLLLGSVGLFIHAHEAIPDLAMLAAGSAAFALLSRSPKPGAPRSAMLRGAGLGAALGISFLSGGLAAPVSVAAAMIAVVLSDPDWRSANALLALAIALLVAGVAAAAWPVALWMRDPQLAAQWLRQLTVVHDTYLGNLRYFVSTASWFAWPAWPLALWALWNRRAGWAEPRFLGPLAALLAAFTVLTIAGPSQDVNFLVVLPPLLLLAAHGMPKLARGAAAALDWFGVMTFALFAGVIWVTYAAMLSGFPPRIARNFLRAAPGFTQPLEPLALALALLLAAAWLWVVFRAASGPTRSLLRWTAGVTLLWGTFAALWLPWVDHLRSYRPVALQIRSQLPVAPPCIAGRSLGNAQRAAFDYHAGIVTQPYDLMRPRACPLLLVQGSPRHEMDGPGKGWVKLADVGRPGDKSERYRLYRIAQ